MSHITFTVSDSLGGTSSTTLDLAVVAPEQTMTPTPEPTMATATQNPTTVASPIATATPSTVPTLRLCAGDCSANGQVTIEELVIMVRIALGSMTVSTCANGDADDDGAITIDEVILAVADALKGCPAAS